MSDDRRFPIQAEDVGRAHPRRPAGTVPWSVGVAAWERYAARYGRDQSVERIAERGDLAAAAVLRWGSDLWRCAAIAPAAP